MYDREEMGLREGVRRSGGRIHGIHFLGDESTTGKGIRRVSISFRKEKGGGEA
jgi:hypothetical protein